MARPRRPRRPPRHRTRRRRQRSPRRDRPPSAAPIAEGAVPPAQSGPGPRVVLNTEPPAPSAARTRHRHDGFYLRLDGGLDIVGGRADFDDGETLRLRGAALVLDLMIGATPADGLTVGGGFWAAALDEPRAEFDGDGAGASASFEPTSGLAYVLVGPFVDVHPSPSRGFHFGAGFGLGFVSLPEATDVELQGDEERARLLSGAAASRCSAATTSGSPPTGHSVRCSASARSGRVRTTSCGTRRRPAPRTTRAPTRSRCCFRRCTTRQGESSARRGTLGGAAAAARRGEPGRAPCSSRYAAIQASGAFQLIATSLTDQACTWSV